MSEVSRALYDLMGIRKVTTGSCRTMSKVRMQLVSNKVRMQLVSNIMT